jgi:hypothetical protein
MKKTILLSLASIAFFGCLSKKIEFRFTVEPTSDEQVIAYAKKNGHSFDRLYRVKSLNTFQTKSTYGIPSMSFVNLYHPDGSLLKAETGSKCEFRVLSYIRDSLGKSLFRPVPCDSCNFNTFFSTKAQMIEGKDADLSNKYKVVVGWAIFTDQKAVLRSRYKTFRELLPSIKQKNPDIVMIGLNLDPVLPEEGTGQ